MLENIMGDFRRGGGLLVLAAVGAALACSPALGEDLSNTNLMASGAGKFGLLGEGTPVVAGSDAMSLGECMERVLSYNETIQIRALEWLASQKRLKASRGIFEPEFFTTVDREESYKKNNAEMQKYFGQLTTGNRTTAYGTGLEMLTGTGAKIKWGYTLRDANNTYLNWPSYSRRYESFAGVSLTQPLMKNAGYDVTVAGIRLASGESALAFQEYRRQMMMIVSRAEAAYWDLFLSQEQFRIRSDSVRVAETLLEDNKVRVQTGKASELEVLQAQAGVALRKARQQEAQQKAVESMNKLTSLFSGSRAYTNLQVRAVDQPAIKDLNINYLASMSEAFQKNPDYISQQTQIKQENIRVMYAQNQRYPELDLKGSYGVNGLGTTIGDSTKDLETRTFDSWSVGVELRIPLTGGTKTRNELLAAKARKQQALLGLKAAETEIANAVDTAIRHVDTTKTSVTNYLVVVDFSQKLLQTELARLETGKTESRKVLEVEENLSEAKSVAMENLIGHQKALIEWDLVKGTALESRRIELTQAQLEQKTAAMLQGGKWTDISYSNFKREAGADFDKAFQEDRTKKKKS